MGKEITQGDKWKLFGMGGTLIAGVWTIFTTDFSKTDFFLHIKFIYSSFLTLGIALSAYYIILKKEEKNAKKK